MSARCRRAKRTAISGRSAARNSSAEVTRRLASVSPPDTGSMSPAEGAQARAQQLAGPTPPIPRQPARRRPLADAGRPPGPGRAHATPDQPERPEPLPPRHVPLGPIPAGQLLRRLRPYQRHGLAPRLPSTLSSPARPLPPSDKFSIRIHVSPCLILKERIDTDPVHQHPEVGSSGAATIGLRVHPMRDPRRVSSRDSVGSVSGSSARLLPRVPIRVGAATHEEPGPRDLERVVPSSADTPASEVATMLQASGQGPQVRRKRLLPDAEPGGTSPRGQRKRPEGHLPHRYSPLLDRFP
jgi:hypothetical protein